MYYDYEKYAIRDHVDFGTFKHPKLQNPTETDHIVDIGLDVSHIRTLGWEIQYKAGGGYY